MMKLKRFTAALLTLVLTLSLGTTASATAVEDTAEDAERKRVEAVYNQTVQSNAISNWPQGPGTYGEAAIVMDVDTGAILYAKDIDEQHYPASITKVLTALIAFENAELSDTVTVTHDCVSFMQPGDSSIGLKEGNILSLEDTMYATLLASANEAAYAVGENVGKNAGHDYAWFVEQMNIRCKELGGNNSNFVNTNGLHDENHYTCARDMALIGQEIYKHPEFFTIVQTREYVIEQTDTVEEHIFQQKHKMLLEGYEAYYEPTTGGKTGYTSKSKNTLITMAEKDGERLVCVVLREESGKSYPDTTALFEYAFNNFSHVSVADLEQSDDVAEILTENNGGYVSLPEGITFENLQMELTADEEPTGEGTLTYTYEGNVVGSVRAKLSQKYLKANGLLVEEPEIKDEKKEEKESDSKNPVFLIGAIILLVVLVLMFVRAYIIRRRRILKRRRRREAMRRQAEMERRGYSTGYQNERRTSERRPENRNIRKK